ncbi:MAG: glycosyl transferase family 90 [Myxococcota bacterium]
MKQITKLLILATILIAFGCDNEREPRRPDFRLSYENQIKRDLMVFSQTGLTPKSVLKSYQQSPHTRLYVEIVDGEVRYTTDDRDSLRLDRAAQIIQLIRQSVRAYGKLQNMALVFNLLDEPQIKICRTDKCESLPLFSFQKTDDYADILFPYVPQFLNIDSRYKDINSLDVSWESKVEQLVWRGSQTGGVFDATNWKEFGRSKLVLKCNEIPALCNAGFSSYSQVTEEGMLAMAGEIGLKERISEPEMMKWKYVASYDGNGWADRFVRLLASGSVVFKQDSPFYEFFYSSLVPYKHYLPVKQDSSDLAEQILWARQNDSKVRIIVKNANEFVGSQMRQPMVEQYVYRLLQTYGDLQRWGDLGTAI